jgi:hypothetical protein
VSFGQSFSTKVSATTIGKKDVLQIEYIAEDVEMDQFVLPAFTKWTVVSGPNLSSSTVATGNQIKQQMVYSVIVQPTTTGTLLVPGATALIDNKPQRSNTIIIKVKNTDHLPGSNPPVQAPKPSLFDQFPFEDELPASQYLKKGEKAIDKIKNNILIRLELSKRSCYVGEPILATYKLCTRLRSKSKVVKQPQFSGCTVVELTGDEQDQHIEKINGTEYNVFVIRKVQLVPLEAGKLVLPQVSVENKVSFYNAAQLNYRDLYYNNPSIPVEEQLVTIQNKPETVDVKPLPAVPTIGTSEFSGAIGNFSIAISTGNEGLTTNKTNKLLFAVHGEGNLQQINTPVIKWPRGIEAFDASQQNEDDKSDFPVKSRKTFTFPFIVDKKGYYTIPPVEFTYFDVNANKYITKSTRALTLNVAQGSKNFLRTLHKSTDAEGFQNRLYIILGAGLLAIVIGFVWYNARQKSPIPVSGAMPGKEDVKEEFKKPDASEYLYAIRELQPDNDSSQFYKQLCKNLHAYLDCKFNLVPGQLPFYIQQHPENATSLLQLKGLLDNCSLGMYTPMYTIEEAMQHRLDAIQVLNSLEKNG